MYFVGNVLSMSITVPGYLFCLGGVGERQLDQVYRNV